MTLGYRCTTRAGNLAVITADDAPGDYPLVGYVIDPHSGESDTWNWMPDGRFSPHAVIEPELIDFDAAACRAHFDRVRAAMGDGV